MEYQHGFTVCSEYCLLFLLSTDSIMRMRKTGEMPICCRRKNPQLKQKYPGRYDSRGESDRCSDGPSSSTHLQHHSERSVDVQKVTAENSVKDTPITPIDRDYLDTWIDSATHETIKAEDLADLGWPYLDHLPSHSYNPSPVREIDSPVSADSAHGDDEPITSSANEEEESLPSPSEPANGNEAVIPPTIKISQMSVNLSTNKKRTPSPSPQPANRQQVTKPVNEFVQSASPPNKKRAPSPPPQPANRKQVTTEPVNEFVQSISTANKKKAPSPPVNRKDKICNPANETKPTNAANSLDVFVKVNKPNDAKEIVKNNDTNERYIPAATVDKSAPLFNEIEDSLPANDGEVQLPLTSEFEEAESTSPDEESYSESVQPISILKQPEEPTIEPRLIVEQLNKRQTSPFQLQETPVLGMVEKPKFVYSPPKPVTITKSMIKATDPNKGSSRSLAGLRKAFGSMGSMTLNRKKDKDKEKKRSQSTATEKATLLIDELEAIKRADKVESPPPAVFVKQPESTTSTPKASLSRRFLKKAEKTFHRSASSIQFGAHEDDIGTPPRDDSPPFTNSVVGTDDIGTPPCDDSPPFTNSVVGTDDIGTPPRDDSPPFTNSVVGTDDIGAPPRDDPPPYSTYSPGDSYQEKPQTYTRPEPSAPEEDEVKVDLSALDRNLSNSSNESNNKPRLSADRDVLLNGGMMRSARTDYSLSKHKHKSVPPPATDSGYESATMRSMRRNGDASRGRSHGEPGAMGYHRSPADTIRTSRTAVDSVPLCLEQLSALNVQTLHRLCGQYQSNNNAGPTAPVSSPSWRDIILENDKEPVFTNFRCIMYRAKWKEHSGLQPFTVMLSMVPPASCETYTPHMIPNSLSFEASVPSHLLPAVITKNKLHQVPKPGSLHAASSVESRVKPESRTLPRFNTQPNFSTLPNPKHRKQASKSASQVQDDQSSQLHSMQEEAIESLRLAIAGEDEDDMKHSANRISVLNTNGNNNMGIPGTGESDDSDDEGGRDSQPFAGHLFAMAGSSAPTASKNEPVLTPNVSTINRLIRSERAVAIPTTSCYVTILSSNFTKVETVKNCIETLLKDKKDQEKVQLDIVYILLQILSIVFSLQERRLQLDSINASEFLMMTDANGLSYIRYHMLSTRPLVSAKLTTTCEKLQLLIMQISHVAPFLLRCRQFSIIDDMFQHASDQGDLRLIYSILQYMLWGPKEEEVKVITLAENRKQAFELWLHLARGKLISLLTLHAMNQHNYMISNYLAFTTGTEMFKITKLLSSPTS